jgi:hypothetical protein
MSPIALANDKEEGEPIEEPPVKVGMDTEHLDSIITTEYNIIHLNFKQTTPHDSLESGGSYWNPLIINNDGILKPFVLIEKEKVKKSL